MTGGGARGAYQAGVLKRVAEQLKLHPAPFVSKAGASPFQVVAGASAGAINGAMLAAGSENFLETTTQMETLWKNLTFDKVFSTDFRSLGSGAALLLKDLSLGGLFGGGKAYSLLDATPLHKVLGEMIPFENIQRSIENGYLHALAVTATDYNSGKSFTFVQGAPGHALWKRSRKVALPVRITPYHIYASAAIPVVFQPGLLSTDLGDSYFGDGCLRLVNPLGPAIRLGAKKILAIGVRAQGNPDAGFERLLKMEENGGTIRPPALSRVLGVILNAIFLDHLDADVEHMERMNEILRALHKRINCAPESKQELLAEIDPNGMSIVEALPIVPSVDIGELAMKYMHKLPKLVRYLMKGLGSSDEESADLVSYLLFDPGYCGELFDIGYKDAEAKIADLENFFELKPHN